MARVSHTDVSLVNAILVDQLPTRVHQELSTDRQRDMEGKCDDDDTAYWETALRSILFNISRRNMPTGRNTVTVVMDHYGLEQWKIQ
jgi:hypothetical protein